MRRNWQFHQVQTSHLYTRVQYAKPNYSHKPKERTRQFCNVLFFWHSRLARVKTKLLCNAVRAFARTKLSLLRCKNKGCPQDSFAHTAIFTCSKGNEFCSPSFVFCHVGRCRLQICFSCKNFCKKFAQKRCFCVLFVDLFAVIK